MIFKGSNMRQKLWQSCLPLQIYTNLQSLPSMWLLVVGSRVLVVLPPLTHISWVLWQNCYSILCFHHSIIPILCWKFKLWSHKTQERKGSTIVLTPLHSPGSFQSCQFLQKDILGNVLTCEPFFIQNHQTLTNSPHATISKV